MMKPVFHEVQRFKQWWLWLILIAPALLILYGIFKQVILGEDFGNKPTSTTVLLIVLLIPLGLLYLFKSMCLKTTIDENGILMQFVPFTKKHTDWSEIRTAEVVDYGFIGGFGVRIGTSYGTVYNISGRMGLALYLEGGEKYLIGTQNAEEMASVVAHFMGVNSK